MSDQMDEVARNRVWREHLVKESRLEGPLTPFQFNPATVSAVTPKPTLVDPREYGDVPESADASPIQEQIEQNSRCPQEKYDYPMTESQGVGYVP